MLARDVWPDAELGKIVAKEYVAVQVYQDKNKEVTGPIIKKYGIRAYPTFIVLDSEGNEIGRPRSMPRNVEGAKEWFPKYAIEAGKIGELEAAFKKEGSNKEAKEALLEAYKFLGANDKALEIFKAAVEADPENIELAMELAIKYVELRQADKALAIYDKLLETTKEDNDLYADVTLGYAKALMGTINRSNQNEVLGKIVTVNEKVLPALIEAKDERAIDAGVLNARIMADINKDAEGANELMAKLSKAFGEGDRVSELKYWSAMVKSSGGDEEGGKADLEALVKDGDEDDKWVKNAKNSLKRMNK